MTVVVQVAVVGRKGGGADGVAAAVEHTTTRLPARPLTPQHAQCAAVHTPTAPQLSRETTLGDVRM